MVIYREDQEFNVNMPGGQVTFALSSDADDATFFLLGADQAVDLLGTPRAAVDDAALNLASQGSKRPSAPLSVRDEDGINSKLITQKVLTFQVRRRIQRKKIMWNNQLANC